MDRPVSARLSARLSARSRVPRRASIGSAISRVAAIFLGAGAFTLSGCNPEQGAAPLVDSPATTLGAIHASPFNVILAVGQTTQITVIGQSLSGQLIADFDSVRYVTQSLTDSIRLQVSPSGLLTGRSSSGSNPVFLYVYAFKNGFVSADEVVIQVTTAPIVGATLSVQPAVGESTQLAQGSSKTVTPIIRDGGGNSVAGAMLRLTYHDDDFGRLGCYSPNYPAIGVFTSAQLSMPLCGSTVGLNQIRATDHTGSAWVIADAMVYGQHQRDSVQYTMVNPSNGQIVFIPWNLSFQGGSELFGDTYIAPGGRIGFDSYFDPSLAASIDVVFDNPAAVTATSPPSSQGGSTGNITGLLSGQESGRLFLTPGTYTYTATVNGSIPPFTGAHTTGRIIVQ